MCTVSLIPINSEVFVLTSNRDESPQRSVINPDVYAHNGCNLLFPKDKKAGGTWIGASCKNRALCLLNGAFVKHNHMSNYTKSRGLIVKDLLAVDDIVKTIKSYKFDKIEPFTLIIADWISEIRFFELVWDRQKVYFKKLAYKPHFWSSSTLYNTQMKKERRQWFEAFIKSQKFNKESILNFHQNTHPENQDYGFIMNRTHVKTTSITQIVRQPNKVNIYFKNLQNLTSANKTLKCLVKTHE